LAHPSLFAGLVFTSVGYYPPGPFDVALVNILTKQALGYPTFGYWKFFDEDEAASILEANPKSVTSLLYPRDPEDWKSTMGPIGAAKELVSNGKTGPLPTWLSEEDARKREGILQKGGYTGPLNW
jgi:hypothetical protein